MLARPLKPGDIGDVLDRLCGAHTAELAFLELDKREAQLLLAGYANAGEATTGEVDGVPVAIFGVAPSHSKNTVWFIATDDYFRQGLGAVRFAKRFLADVAGRFGVLHAATSSGGVRVEKWLRTLGFKKVNNFNGFNNFVYAP